MVFAPAAMAGIYAEVFTGLPRMVSGVPATREGCHRYCPLPSFSFRMDLMVESFSTHTDFLRYGDFRL